MFRHAYRKSRVLVPADAFYEWNAESGGKKQPYLIRMRDESPFGMAGLLEHWHGPGAEILSFAILTTEPNALMAEIHNRMPVVVRPKDYARLRPFPRFGPQKLAHLAFQHFLQRLLHQVAVARHCFHCRQLRITLPRGHGSLPRGQGRSRQSTFTMTTRLLPTADAFAHKSANYPAGLPAQQMTTAWRQRLSRNAFANDRCRKFLQSTGKKSHAA